MNVNEVLEALDEIKISIDESSSSEDLETVAEVVRKLRDDQEAIECPSQPPCVCDLFDHLVDALDDNESGDAIEQSFVDLRDEFREEARKWIKDVLDNIENEPDMDHHEREAYLAEVSKLEDLLCG